MLGFYANYARIEGLDLERLTHTWFIAVIAHFYVLWPLAIAALRARHRTRIVGGLALAAIAWRAIAIEVMSPGWVYNATDTNAAALLVGCYLAVARPTTWRFARWSVPGAAGAHAGGPHSATRAQPFSGAVSVALALSALTVQYALTGPVWLANRVLLRVAELSFGFYLWHYVFIRSDIALWLALVLTVAATAASWYLLEQPVLRWAARRKGQARETSSAIGVSAGAMKRPSVFQQWLALAVALFFTISVVSVYERAITADGDAPAIPVDGDGAVDVPAPIEDGRLGHNDDRTGRGRVRGASCTSSIPGPLRAFAQ